RPLLGLGALGLRPPGAAQELAEAVERELEQPLPRLVRVGALADGVDHAIDVAGRHPEALDDLALGLGLAQLVAGAAGDDLAPVLDEVLERLLQVEHGGPAVRDAEVDDAEARLEVGEPEELV